MSRTNNISYTLAAIVALSSLPAMADEGTDLFEKKIRPVLIEHCYKCHSVESGSPKGGLLLDSREGARQGGDSGAAVVPHQVDQSLLISALKYDSFEMPPSGKLPDEVIADFEKWISLGAPDPREASTKQIQKITPAEIDWDKARQHWAYTAPVAHELPQVKQSDWPQRRLDTFILKRLEEVGLQPSEEASREILLRRVTYDLTGLPPTPSEIDHFLGDDSPSAYENVVERLLASTGYGERWARLWLDVSRYAEDQAHIVGNNRELCYPNAYLYRNWVISAWNADMPYDEFLIRQLANDLLASEDEENVAALGFIGLGPKYYRRNAPEVMADEWEDRVDTVSRGLLGITVACARCHHHKYDPITTEDYYALAGVFASTEMFNRPLKTDAELKNDGNAKDPIHAVHVLRDLKPRNLNVMIRGDVANPGPEVPRQFLRILSHDTPAPFQQGSGRLELARQIASRDNPLTARVIVNRVWAQHFGKPLVRSMSNFGVLGDKPTHPELLDDLSVRFMDNGWSLKWLNREIVLSRTYRQSSQIDSRHHEIDPENKLLGHMNRKKLAVEMWRDGILSATGELVTDVGGKSINPAGEEELRRTVYSEISRLELNKMLSLFDFPDPNTHSPGRVQTTTPLQQLFVLNSPWMVHRAESLTTLLEKEGGSNLRYRIDLAYRRLYARYPNEAEVSLAETYLNSSPENHERWIQFSHALLSGNEMLFLD